MTKPTGLVRERRRAFRITVAGAFELRHVAIAQALPVLDISFEGFAIESPVPFLVGTTNQFHFTAADGTATSVEAVVARCLRIEIPDSERYLAGFAFVSESNSQRSSIAKVLNAVAVSL